MAMHLYRLERTSSTIKTAQAKVLSLKSYFFFTLMLLSFGQVFAESCSVLKLQQQASAEGHTARHENNYAACIACCGGISPEQATGSCGGLPIPYHALTDGKEVWTEYRYCHPTGSIDNSCISGEFGRTQCTLTTEAQPRTNNCTNPTVGNPVIVATGDKFQSETDYPNQKPFGLDFVRYYSSTTYDVTNFGTKWRHNYSSRIVASSANALVYRSNGQALPFSYDGTNWAGAAHVSDTLVETVDGNAVRTGWIYTTSNDTIETYNATGQLTQITNRANQSHILTYDLTVAAGGDDDDATLDRIIDSFDGVLSFSYNNTFTFPRRIASMTDPHGNVYRYSYDANGNLASVAYPDDTPANDADNPTRIYHYEHATFTHQLTGKTDETGNRYVTWVYDNEGRAISSELAGGVDKSTLAYNTDGSVTVTNPLNKQTTYQFTTLHGVKKLTSVTGHPTANCAGDYKTYTYDANGYLASKTDWNGHLTTYQHDSSGRELSRTEVIGTPEERTITTEWHADYRVPIRITASGKITEFVYDTQGRLLSQTVRSAP